MKDFDNIIVEQLDEYKFDCLVSEAIKNKNVVRFANRQRSNIEEANKYTKAFLKGKELKSKPLRDAAATILKWVRTSKLPTDIKKELFKNPKRTLTTAGLLSVIGVAKISSGVYKLYLKAAYPKCAKIRNGQAKNECMLQAKIKAKVKTIQQLMTLRGKGDKEAIDEKIAKLRDDIKILKSRSLNIGLEF